MAQPVQITFRHLDSSPRLEALVKELADKLDLASAATRFHVTIEGIRRPHSSLFEVSIDLALPGGELHVGQDARLSRVGEDAYAAVRDAFHALRRQLQDHAMRRRGEVKVHAPGRSLRGRPPAR